MKTFKILAAIFFLCFCLPAFAQNEALKVKPSTPKRGDSVVLTYSPAKSQTGLAEAKSVTAHILYANEEKADVLEKEMVGKKGVWKATFQVPDQASIMAVRFTSEEKSDDHNGDCWNIPVFGKDKKPLKNAYLFLSSLHQMGEYKGFKFDKSKEAVKKCIEKELEGYPDNTSANTMKWSQLMNEFKGSDSIKSMIGKELVNLFHANSAEKEIYPLLAWFDRTGMQKEGKALKDSILKVNPRGYVALQDKLRSVMMNPNVPANDIEQIFADFPEMEPPVKTMLASVLVNSYMKTKEFQKAQELIVKADLKDGMMFNNLAWPLIEKGENLEEATSLASRGVELIRNQKEEKKSASPAVIKNLNTSLGMVLDTYGYGLEQLGKTGDALKAYAEAYELTEGLDENINGRYVQLLAKSNDNAKAVEIAEACILKGKADDKAVTAFRGAYKQLHGSADGADAKLNQLAAEAKARLTESLKKEMLNQPAPDFSLKDLDGNVVKLSDLKGKVVVVDFWATWCGPCKSSFPGLQKVVEQYKNNPEIQILTLNTWEREKNVAEKEQKVKAFIADNKYSFKVLFDDADIVGKYGVTGIPTKFIIDKKGMIQFKTVGFDGEQKMIAEMQAQFELLLNAQ